MEQMRRPTIREVAREAGVSVATVSYALRRHEAIPEPTRQRVAAAAARLGYRRNPAFAALGALAHRHAASREGLGLGYFGRRWREDQIPAGGACCRDWRRPDSVWDSAWNTTIWMSFHQCPLR